MSDVREHTSPETPPNALTREDYVRVVRTLFGVDADEMIAVYDEGWLIYQVGDPLSLGLAAVSGEVARTILRTRPDLEPLIREMQQDPDAALARLRRRIDGESGDG